MFRIGRVLNVTLSDSFLSLFALVSQREIMQETILKGSFPPWSQRNSNSEGLSLAGNLSSLVLSHFSQEYRDGTAIYVVTQATVSNIAGRKQKL